MTQGRGFRVQSVMSGFGTFEPHGCCVANICGPAIMKGLAGLLFKEVKTSHNPGKTV